MFSRACFRSSSRLLPDIAPRALSKPPIRRQPILPTFQRFESQYRGPPPSQRRSDNQYKNYRYGNWDDEIRRAKPLVTTRQIKGWVTSRPTKWIAIVIAGGSFLLVVTNIEEVPVSGRKRFNCMSDSTVEGEARQAYKKLLQEYQGSILPPNDRRVRMVMRVMKRLIEAGNLENVDWEVHVVYSEEKNAMVLPGGKVFVFSGILPVAGDDDGLAAILGHEIAHNVARHAAEQMSWLIPLMPIRWALLFLDYSGYTGGLGRFLGDIAMELGITRPASRKMESEADYIGLVLMSKACYNPDEAIGLWQRMDAAQEESVPQWLSTHPANASRIENFRKWLPEAQSIRADAGCDPGHVEAFPDFISALKGMMG